MAGLTMLTEMTLDMLNPSPIPALKRALS